MNTGICMRSRFVLTNPATERLFTRLSIPHHSPLPTSDWKKQVLCFATRATDETSLSAAVSKQKKIYLHVGPSGDSWIGDAIFAAKHNQPGYVKSIEIFDDDNFICKDISKGIKEDEGSLMIDVLDEHPDWAQEIYDTEAFPAAFQQHLKSIYEEDNNS